MTMEGGGKSCPSLLETAVHILLVGLLALQHLQVDKNSCFKLTKQLETIYKYKLSSGLLKKGVPRHPSSRLFL